MTHSPPTPKTSRKGFTIIELLLGAAIVSVVSTVAVIALNPAELIKKGRDARRVSDVDAIASAVTIYTAEMGGGFGDSSYTYISLPSINATTSAGDDCAGWGLPALPSGYSYRCAASSTYRATDGTGWIPLNFTSLSTGSPFGALPIDPINVTSSGYFYTFNVGSFEVTSAFESKAYSPGGTNAIGGKDAGKYATRYEKGTDLSLLPIDPGNPVTTAPVLTGIAASAIGQSYATIGWSTDQNADSRVNYGLTTSYGLTAYDGTYSTSHSINLTGLATTTTYHYQVVSANANGTTQSSDFTFSTVANSAPGAPTLSSPIANATGTSLTPTFLASATDANGDTLKYKITIYSNSGCTSSVQTNDQTATTTGWSAASYASGAQASFTVQTPLTASTTYYWRASAIDPAGSNIWTDSATCIAFTTITPPAAPGTPTYANISTTGLTINWSVASGATSYKLERSTSGTSFAQIATPASNTYADSGLNASTTYYYRVRATNAAGDGAYSASSSVTTAASNSAPAAPSQDSPLANATGTSLTPTFYMTATDANSDTLKYKVTIYSNSICTTVSETNDQTATTIGWSAASYASGAQASFTVQTPLTASTTYYWRASAIDPAGTNTWTDSVTCNGFTTLTVPGIPGTPTYASVATTTLTINWSAASGATSYKLERSTSGTSFAQIATPASNTYADSGLNASTTYYYRVRGTNVAGDGAYSASSSVTTAASNSAPAAPSQDSPLANATGTSLSPTFLMTATDANSDTLKYKVTIYSNSICTTVSQTNDQTATTTGWSAASYASGVQASFVVQTPLTASTTYYWRASAIDPAGTNTWTDSVTCNGFTTNSLPSTPGTPTYSNIATSTVTVGWASSTNASYYQLFMGTDGVNFPNYQTVFSTTKNYAGLSPNTTYYFRVRASNNAGNSAFSASSSVTTAAISANSSPSAPSLDYPTNGGYADGASPTFKMTATDANGDSLKYKVSLYTQAGCGGAASYTYDQTATTTGWSAASYASGVQGILTVTDVFSTSTTFYWQAGAIDPAGSNMWTLSTACNSFIIPDVPRTMDPLTVSIVGSSTVRLVWNTYSNATKYEVQRSTDGISFAKVAETSVTEYWDSGLTPGAKYYYRGRAGNTNGWGGLSTPVSTTTYVTVPPPSAPSQDSPLAAAVVQNLAPSFAMTASAPTGADLKYKVTIYSNSICTAVVQTNDQTVSATGWSAASYTSGSQGSYTVQTPLTASTTYYWRASAIDPQGSNIWTDSTTCNSFSTPSLPTAPTSVTFTNVQTSTLTVNWPSVSGATYYSVKLSIDGTSFMTIATTTGVSYADTGLSPNTTYYFKVSATNAIGAGPDSSSYSVTTAQVYGSKVTIFVSSTAASTWTVPSDWNSASNTIEVIGGGGAGGGGAAQEAGGAGGGYSKITNFSLTPSSIIGIDVGSGGTSATVHGGDTWVCNATSNCTSASSSAVIVSARGGGSANATVAGTATTTFASGTVKYVGGGGGSTANGGGGGGAAGPNGAGNPGVTGAGGSGDAGFGGAGGVSGNNPGSGYPGTEWSSSPAYGSGGGGGGGTKSGKSGTVGGSYGAGSGGNNNVTAPVAGKQGLIVAAYTPAATVNPSEPLLLTPENGSTSVPVIPVFKLSATESRGNTLQYRVALYSDSGCSSQIAAASQVASQVGWSGQNASSSESYTSGSTATYTWQSTLDAGVTYYWKGGVIAQQGTNVLVTSPVCASFTTVSYPGTPGALSSSNNTGNSVTISWGASSNTTYYKVERGTDGVNFTQIATTTQTYYADATISSGSTYYYRVRGTNAFGDGPYTASNFSLIANRVPGAPSLDSPLSAAVDVATSTQFFMTATDPDSDTLKYKVTIYSNALCTTVVQTNSQTTSTLGWSAVFYTSGAQANYVLQTPLSAGTTYYWRATAIDTLGTNTGTDSASCNSFTTKAVPGSASSPATTAIATTTITLQFSSVTGADYYSLERSTDGVNFSQIATTTDLSFSDTDLSPGTTYYYRFQGVNTSGGGSYSTPLSVTTVPPAPGTPTYASITSSTLVVNWTAATGTSYYKLERGTDGVNFTQRATTTNLTYSDSGLTAGNTYYYRVRGTNSGGDGPYSASSSQTTNASPSAPSQDSPLSAATGVPTTTVFQMTATDANNDALKYKVTLYSNALCTAVVATADQTASTVGWSATSYASGAQGTYTTQSPLTAGATYYWKASAIDPTGSNVWTDSTTCNNFTTLPLPSTPGTPTYTSITASSFTVNWATSSNATFYQLDRSSDGTTFASQGTTTASTLNQSGNAGDLIYYRVRASNASGFGSYSALSSVQLIPGVPGVPTYTNIQGSTLTVNWTAGAGAASYKLERGTDGVNFSQIAAPSSNTYGDSGLSAGTAYYYRVRSTNSTGDGAYSASSSVTTNIPPTAPSQDSPLASATGTIVTPTFYMTATDANSDTLKYKVTIYSNSICTTVSQTNDQTVSATGWSAASYASGAQASFVVQTPLAASTTYYWRASAIDTAGSNTWTDSATCNGFTTGALPTAPGTPYLPYPTMALTTEISISYDVATSADYYRIENSLDGTNFTEVQTSTGNFPTITGLATATIYYWRVRGANSIGNGPYSASSSIATNMPPNYLYMYSPANGATNVALQPTFAMDAGDPNYDGISEEFTLYSDSQCTNVIRRYLETDNQWYMRYVGPVQGPCVDYGDGLCYFIPETPLATSTTYYWKGSARDPYGSNIWADSPDCFSFTTGNVPTQAPGAPTYTEIASTSLRVSWTAVAGATGYYLERSTSSSGSSPTGYSIGPTTTIKFASNMGLLPSTTYYWRVAATNSVGAGPYSATSSVTTYPANYPPYAPSQDAPLAGATGVSVNPTFYMTATDQEKNALKYKVAIYTDSICTAVLQTADQTVSAAGWTASSYPSGGQAQYTLQTPLTTSTTYYWRASAIDPAGNNSWTDSATCNSFTTATGQTPTYVAGTWVTNGAVNALVSTGTSLYIGGTFTAVGDFVGTGASFDTVSGSLNPLLLRVNGGIQTAVSDEAGGWYIGGYFTTVNSVSRRYLAHIFSDGSLDTAWNPNPNGGVLDLFVSTSSYKETMLYAVGNFTTISGVSRGRVAEFKLSDGSITSWNPGADAGVSGIIIPYNSTVAYIVGSFSNIGGQARNRIAAVSLTTGTSTTWNPNASGTNISAIAYDGTNNFAVGGSFTSIGGAARNNIAFISQTSGSSTSWNPNVSGTVSDIEISTSTVYVGGTFTNIGGAARNNLAEVSRSTNSSTAWNPNVGGQVYDIVLRTSTLYVAGNYTGIGGTIRNRAAELLLTTGSSTSWNPNLSAAGRTIVVATSSIFVGGDYGFAGSNWAARSRIARINLSTGQADSWNPNANGNVNALVLSTSTIYVGGAFTTIGGQSRNRIAEIALSTGTATTWNPNASGTVNAIVLSTSTIYVGGDFTNIALSNGRNRIAEITRSGGTATAWNPNANGTISSLVLSTSTIYAGGAFTNIGAAARNDIAQVLLTTGSSTAWNPNVSGTVSDIHLSTSTLYVAGSFSSVGGQTRNNIAELLLTTGSSTAWNPNPNAAVYSTGISGSKMYVAGAFTSIGGASATGLASVDLATGNAIAMSPSESVSVASVWIADSDGKLSVGSDSSRYGILIFNL